MLLCFVTKRTMSLLTKIPKSSTTRDSSSTRNGPERLPTPTGAQTASPPRASVPQKSRLIFLGK